MNPMSQFVGLNPEDAMPFYKAWDERSPQQLMDNRVERLEAEIARCQQVITQAFEIATTKQHDMMMLMGHLAEWKRSSQKVAISTD